MSIQAFFARSELRTTLWAFRREFMVVGLFSMVANLLMLSPTLYMLQVYDRVLASRSELTLEVSPGVRVVANLPRVQADPGMLRLVWQNLLSMSLPAL